MDKATDRFVTLTMSVSEAEADYIGGVSTEAFWQIGRFQFPGSRWNYVDDSEELVPWAGVGTMTWCGCPAEWLIKRAYEIECGFEAVLLLDKDSGYDNFVVLSSRPFVNRD